MDAARGAASSAARDHAPGGDRVLRTGDLADERAEPFRFDRLLGGWARVALEEGLCTRRECTTRHEGDPSREIGAAAVQALEELDAVDHRHLQVAEDDVPRLARRGLAQGLGGRGEGGDVVIASEDPGEG